MIHERLGKLNPPPVRGTIPVLIGGGGEQVMLRLVAQWAATWHAFGAPDVIAHKSRVLDEHCAAIGRDPAEIERSVMVTSDDIAKGYSTATTRSARGTSSRSPRSPTSTSPICGACSPGATPLTLARRRRDSGSTIAITGPNRGPLRRECRV